MVHWSGSPISYVLPENVVHIWKTEFGVSDMCLQRCYTYLNSHEYERAARYHFAEPRTRFVVARATLRYLISRYTDIAPNRVVLIENQWGKPVLASSEATNLEFNIAHSHELALFAFCRNKPVGIDIEYVRELPDMQSIVNHYFSETERDIYAHLSDEVKLNAFYRGWTCKEAYIKARGKGLSIPLTAFDVSLDPSEPAGLMMDRIHPGANLEWTLVDLKPAEDYTAALAIRQQSFEISMYSIECPEAVECSGCQ